ncbi:uncharacterized protein LOC110736974 [Chenopodium quinoa]|nr:uncharacterized protein LOC110736974 [Chenopodium quinoa]
MYPNGGRPKRSASNGKWKAISRPFDITDKRYGILIGHKRILAYEEIGDSNEKTLNHKKKSKKTLSHKKKDDDSKPITTIWGMYEYWIHESSEILQLKKDYPSTRLDYVLCIIYKKENKGKGRKKSKNSPLVATDKKEGQLVLNDKRAENAAVGTTIEHPCTSLPIPSAFEVGSTSSSTINLAENAAVGTIIGHPCTSLLIPSAFEVGSTSSSTINLAENAAIGTIIGHPCTSLLIPSAFEVGSTSSSGSIKPAENVDVGTTIEHPCTSSSMPSTFEVGSTSNSTINEYPGHTSMPSTFEVGNTSSNTNNATYNFDDIMMDLSWLNEYI